MNKELRTKIRISKIFIKWGLNTRQVAINEIMGLFRAERKELIKRLEGEKKKIHNDITTEQPKELEGYNQAIDKAIENVKEL